MIMKPIGTNVLVKPFPSPEYSEGGLLVPDSCKKDNNKVTIVAVGNGTKDRPMMRKVGDVGFRVKNWGQELIIGEEKYFLMDQSAILALE
jgi:chaperonin GroES